MVQYRTKNGITKTHSYENIKGFFTFPFIDVLGKLPKPSVYYYVICRAPYHHRKTTVYGRNPHPFNTTEKLPSGSVITVDKIIDAFSFTKPSEDYDGHDELFGFLSKATAETDEPQLFHLLKSLYIDPKEKNEKRKYELVLEKLNILDSLQPNQIQIQNENLRKNLDYFIVTLVKHKWSKFFTREYHKVLNRISARRTFSNAQQFYQLENEHKPQSAFNMPKSFGEGGKRTKRRRKHKHRKTKKLRPLTQHKLRS
jgi:hypothetical protein